jgi:sugar phosphate isomerase/epimerase
MKAGLVICGPDVDYGPLALLSGTFEQKADKAARQGYDGIELMVRDPACLNWPAVKNKLDCVGLEVSQVVTGELFGADGLCLVTADNDLYQRTMDRTRAVIDLAAYLGAMVNIGRLRGRLEWLGPVPNAIQIAVERIRAVAKYAAQKGVRITLEPINRYETDFLFSAKDSLQFVREVGCDNVGLMLDLFHMNIEDESIEDGLREVGDRLWHVHIADSNRKYPGSGHLDFPCIFDTLKQMKYTGYISAELLPLPDPDMAAAKTILFLKKWLA